MYTIGELSRITNTTIKALRHYHDKGVLVPSYIEETTNYRYYNHSDVEKVSVIATLKLVGFSLNEIAVLLREKPDDDDISALLHIKKNEITTKINILNQASSTIDLILNRQKEAFKMTEQLDEIQLKSLKDIAVITTRWQGKYQDCGDAIGKVYRSGGRHSCAPVMNLYFDAEYKEIADIETCLPVKKAIKGPCEYKTLTGGSFLTVNHIGPYETIGTSYERLFEYINAQGISSQLPIREIYHKGPGMVFKGNPNKYITEIQIPILG